MKFVFVLEQKNSNCLFQKSSFVLSKRKSAEDRLHDLEQLEYFQSNGDGRKVSEDDGRLLLQNPQESTKNTSQKIEQSIC